LTLDSRSDVQVLPPKEIDKKKNIKVTESIAIQISQSEPSGGVNSDGKNDLRNSGVTLGMIPDTSSAADQLIIMRKTELSGAQTVHPVVSTIGTVEGAPVGALKRIGDGGRPRSGVLSSVSEESDIMSSHDLGLYCLYHFFVCQL